MHKHNLYLIYLHAMKKISCRCNNKKVSCRCVQSAYAVWIPAFLKYCIISVSEILPCSTQSTVTAWNDMFWEEGDIIRNDSS